MSENLHELCFSIVEEFYGSFHARLFSCLTSRGRLSAPQLAQISHLPLRQVKLGLAALTQARLIYHHTTSEYVSTYQANFTSTYNLLRIGRLIDLAQSEYGEGAAAALSEAFLLGFTTIAELEIKATEFLSRQQALSANGERHSTEADVSLQNKVRPAIRALMDHGYLSRIRSAHLQTHFDARQDAQSHLRSLGLLTPGKGRKGALEIEEKIEEELKRRTATQTAERGYVPSNSTQYKRPLDEVDNGDRAKRLKLNGDEPAKVNGYTESPTGSHQNDNTILVCVNFNKLITNIRNESLARRVSKSLGKGSGQVLMKALSQIQVADQWSDDTTDGWLDIKQVQNDVNHPTSGHLLNGYQQNGVTKTNGIHIHEDEETSNDMTFNEVDRSLALLADSEFNFLHGAYGKEWRISKREVNSFVQQHETLRMMGDRLGPPALRIVRILLDKGKVDEKALQEVGLLGAKDLRQTLAKLQQFGYIDLQEVPRESQRQPNRTIFLWFYDSARVQKVLLDGLYKAMARLMQRLKVERQKLASTLEKLERSDVQGNEEQIMSAAELRVLRRWQRTEQWIFGQMTRLDESVALLRDL